MKHWTVGRRLGTAFALVMLIGVLMAGLAAWGMEATVASLKTVYDDRTVPLTQLAEINHLVTYDRVLLTDAAHSAQPESTRQRVDEVRRNRERVGALWKEYLATYLTPEEKGIAAQVEEKMKSLVGAGHEAVIAALAAGRPDEARNALEQKVGPANPAFTQAMDKLIALQARVASEEYAASSRRMTLLHTALATLSLVGVVLATAVAMAITRGIVNDLGAEPHALAAAAERVAAGDLADDGRPAARRGSVMASMQTMRASLVHLVGTVRQGVENVATASSQIAQGNHDLSGRTEQQASSLQQTAASMEQLTGTVRTSADNARQANQLASSASDVAQRGGQVVAEVVKTMDEIQSSSRRIADITGVIDGIAFQTNILALNAAVEAARAGEQGRGFAVVAGEVRTLAQRSAEAAREIKSLIGESVGRVESGGALVKSAGQTMDEIVGQVRRVTDLIAEITYSSDEQSKGIGQVNEAVTQLDQTTQQNAALVEQSAAAAESLKVQAARLSEAVAAFRLGAPQPVA